MESVPNELLVIILDEVCSRRKYNGIISVLSCRLVCRKWFELIWDSVTVSILPVPARLLYNKTELYIICNKVRILVPILLSPDREKPLVHFHCNVNTTTCDNRIYLTDDKFHRTRNVKLTSKYCDMKTAIIDNLYDVVDIFLTIPHVTITNSLLKKTEDYEMLKLLFTDTRFDPSFNNNHLLETAILIKNIPICELIISHPKFKGKLKRYLRRFCTDFENHRSIIEKVIRRSDIFLKDEHYCNMNKLLNMVIEYRSNCWDNWPLKIAVRDNYTNLIELLSKDPKVDVTVANSYISRK